ncbi:phage tail terminator-like protein [Gallibacterium genomosp. 3]|uniref:Phage protein n=1 Tax=Gallibacterium genomosp. 3 TaxID=505345 RepID=A0A1A7PVW7_9PAST|nr:phage tail terminator-like protein [Gallibacterium genomosp. 3]OBX06184.1 hypothetical protein QV07_08870 [Gallibacterium genomosp. 3]
MITEVRSILQTHLISLDDFNTAWEGVESQITLPYQTVYLQPVTAVTTVISDKPKSTDTGYLQVTLYYESNQGTQAITERAESIRNHFYGLNVIQNNVQVVIHSPPQIGGIFLNDGALALPITINYTAYQL